MKEFHAHKNSGKPYIFDMKDFNNYISEKMELLKSLEADWHATGQELEKLKESHVNKEREIDTHIKELKLIMGKYHSMEMKSILTNATAYTDEDSNQLDASSESVISQSVISQSGISQSSQLEIAAENQELKEDGEPGFADSGSNQAEILSSDTKEIVAPSEDLGQDSKEDALEPAVPNPPADKRARKNIRPDPKNSPGIAKYFVPYKEVGDEFAFTFLNGVKATSVRRLKQAIMDMTDNELSYHINESINHFAPWVLHFFDDGFLHDEIAGAESPDELRRLLKVIEFS